MIRRFIFVPLVGAVLAAGIAVLVSAQIPPGRFGIGDSILLSTSDELAPLGYGINAEVGRQFSAGLEVARRMANHGKLPRIVVFHLGTNGPIAAEDCAILVDIVGNRLLFLVTVKVPRPWEASNNDTINACVSASDRVHVVRWYARASLHPEWFGEDGYHPNAEGQAAFVALVNQVVDETMAARRAARSGP